MSDIYTVQRILAHKVIKGETLYHVAWKGYSINEATWEPIQNFIDLDVIHDYWTKVNDPKVIAAKKAEKATAKAKRDAIKQAVAAETAKRVLKKKVLAQARAYLKQAKRDFKQAIVATNAAAAESSRAMQMAADAMRYASEHGPTDVQSYITHLTTHAKKKDDERKRLIAAFPQYRAAEAIAKEKVWRLEPDPFLIPQASSKLAEFNSHVLARQEQMGGTLKENMIAEHVERITKEKQWACPNDDMVHAWTYGYEPYYRNYKGQIWKKDANGECGDWVGTYQADSHTINTQAEEPEEYR